MAGPLSVQRFPNGLLPLLGMQVGGDAPRYLSDSLVGNINVLPFYSADRQRAAQGTGQNITTTGAWTAASPTIPVGEQWLVSMISAQVTQAAATTGTYRLVLARNYLAPNTYYGLGNSASLAAGAFCNLAWVFDTPILLRGADQWGLIAEAYTGAGNSQTFAQCIYVPLVQ